MRKLTLICLPILALSLSACDVAGEMAGDAIKEQIRTEVVSRCEQIALDNGITSANVAPACQCATDNLVQDASDGSLEINQQKILDLLNTCSADATGGGDSAPTEPQPAS